MFNIFHTQSFHLFSFALNVFSVDFILLSNIQFFYTEAEEIEGDFMYNINGRAFSEVQLQHGENSFSRESVDSGYHPVRKARSSPIKQSRSKSASRGSLNRSGQDLRMFKQQPDSNNNKSDSYGNRSMLSLQSKVGLFAGKGSEQDLGPSARRLRVRGSNSNVSKGGDDGDYGTPVGFSSPNGSSSLKKFKTTESLLDLSEPEFNIPRQPFFYQENMGDKLPTPEQDSKKSQTLLVSRSGVVSSNCMPGQKSIAFSKPRSTADSLPRKFLSKSDSFPLDDLSEDEIPNRAWRLSEDSDTSLSSGTSGASKGSVKFKFDRGAVHGDIEKRSNEHCYDGKEYYSKSNLSLVIRNRLAGNQIHKSNASIARGTTIIDALKLETKDCTSSVDDSGSSEKRSAPIRMRPPPYRPRGSLSSSSTDSANVIENVRFSHDSPASPPSSLPSSLSSVPSSEEAARKAKETLASFPVGNRKRVSTVSGSLVISRI